MSRSTAATLPIPVNYDDCRIITCLKKIFTCTPKSKVDAGFMVCNHIADVKKELEALNSKGTLELSYDYLYAMEQSMPDVSFRYLVVKRENEAILFACFQLFTLTSRNFNLEKNKGFVKGIVHFFLDLKKATVLISGNALRNDTVSFCFNENILSMGEAIEIIASAGERIAADEKAAALLVKDIQVPAGKQKWFAKAGFEMPWKDLVMSMYIKEDWTALSDYVQELSRKYRTRANKILASGSKLVIKQLQENELHHYEEELHRLFKNVTDSQSFVLTVPNADHFSLLKGLYGDNFEITAFFLDEKPVAFYSAFITADAYELYYVGFDYELNNDYQLYFNILFAGLSRAILLKKRLLKLGRTSFDAKASLGAKPVEMDYFYKRGNVPAAVSKWFSGYFSAMEDGKWKMRNPLTVPIKTGAVAK